jgi:hypothetical protein
MPVYFFHINKSEEMIIDPEGTEISNAEEARKEAFLVARESIITVLQTNQPVRLDDSVQVVNERGDLLHLLTFEEALHGYGEHRRTLPDSGC